MRHFGKPYRATRALKDLHTYEPVASRPGCIRPAEHEKRLLMARQLRVRRGLSMETLYYRN